jgi:hypothetical protein
LYLAVVAALLLDDETSYPEVIANLLDDNKDKVRVHHSREKKISPNKDGLVGIVIQSKSARATRKEHPSTRLEENHKKSS